jgi:hypothetical protein
MKGGTTSLHALLGRHPEIFMSREKELDFFSRGVAAGRDEGWYRSQFRTDRRLCGESSPSYAAWPHRDGVAERIAATLPEVRIVYCVRDPIARAISHYKHALATGYRVRPPDEALPREYYLRPGRYATQLERYLLAGIPPDRIHVVQSEALRAERDATLADVLRFLGADPAAMPEAALPGELHDSRRKRVPGDLGRRVKEWVSPLTRRLPWSLRTHVERAALAPFSGPMPEVEISTGTRARLAEILGPEAERLRAMTGLRLDGWSV